MKKIAMKCTQEQFDAVMPRLSKKGFTLNSVTCFEKYPYLFCNVRKSTISNVDKEILEYLVCKEIHETWNEKIFLEACGIEIMKKPTLEEVKEYFKDAEFVETISFEEKRKIDLDSITTDEDGDFWCVEKESGYIFYIASPKLGFAKILTTKEKTFSITAGQLLKEWFPEVFEVKLEVGKWYKNGDLGYEKSIARVLELHTDGEQFSGYGIDCKGNWIHDIDNTKRWGSNNWIEATEQEVFEALKNEAIKRGFVEGVCCGWGGGLIKCEFLKFVDGKLWCNEDNIIMNEKGKWAKIIQTCTREEAEKELNCKIID